MALGTDEGGGGGEDFAKALHGTKRDYVEASRSKRFCAGGLYIDVRQCKSSSDFAEEGGLFVVRFDQGERDIGSPQLDGDARESGAGADVGQGEAAGGGSL